MMLLKFAAICIDFIARTMLQDGIFSKKSADFILAQA